MKLKRFDSFLNENLNPRKEAILSNNKILADILKSSELEIDCIGDEYIHVTFNNKMYSISTQYSGYDANGQIKCDFFISNDDDSFGYYDIDGVLNFFELPRLNEN